MEVRDVFTTGTFQPTPLDDVYKAETVAVDTETGQVLHPFFGNQNYPNIQILDRGSDVSAFKVIAFSNDLGGRDGLSFVNTTYFQLNTFEEGSESSFIALTGATISTGLCQ